MEDFLGIELRLEDEIFETEKIGPSINKEMVDMVIEMNNNINKSNINNMDTCVTKISELTKDHIKVIMEINKTDNKMTNTCNALVYLAHCVVSMKKDLKDDINKKAVLFQKYNEIKDRINNKCIEFNKLEKDILQTNNTSTLKCVPEDYIDPAMYVVIKQKYTGPFLNDSLLNKKMDEIDKKILNKEYTGENNLLSNQDVFNLNLVLPDKILDYKVKGIIKQDFMPKLKYDAGKKRYVEVISKPTKKNKK